MAVDFGKYDRANKVDVIVHNEVIGMINNPDKIRDLLGFFGQRRDGWYEPLAGPRAALVRFSLYENDRFLGELGLGWKYITSLSLSRDAPEREITDLARRLNVQWPPAR